MRKVIFFIVILTFTIFLSGCSDIQRNNFVYYDGYNDEEGKYFDEYAIVYENDDYNLTLYAVRDESIIDTNGDQYVNYLMDWDISKVTTVNLSCGNYGLINGSRGWSPGGMDSHLIPGQEVDDYCSECTEFVLELPDEDIAQIEIYRNDNSIELDWKEVSGINESNISIFIRDNSSTLTYILVALLITLLLSVGYVTLYKRNYNNFTRGIKVKRLPNMRVINVVLAVILILASVVIIYEHERLIHRYDSNFYDYEDQESSIDYLPIFLNDNYTLIGAEGNQEIYVDVQSSDYIEYYFVLVDNNERYVMDIYVSNYPNASVYDSVRVELYQKESDNGGLIFGHIIAQYQFIDGEFVQVSSLSKGVTENIDGETLFVDFLDLEGSLQEYYKNLKGYYKINYLNINSSYFQDNEINYNVLRRTIINIYKEFDFDTSNLSITNTIIIIDEGGYRNWPFDGYPDSVELDIDYVDIIEDINEIINSVQGEQVCNMGQFGCVVYGPMPAFLIDFNDGVNFYTLSIDVEDIDGEQRISVIRVKDGPSTLLTINSSDLREEYNKLYQVIDEAYQDYLNITE